MRGRNFRQVCENIPGALYTLRDCRLRGCVLGFRLSCGRICGGLGLHLLGKLCGFYGVRYSLHKLGLVHLAIVGNAFVLGNLFQVLDRHALSRLRGNLHGRKGLLRNGCGLVRPNERGLHAVAFRQKAFVKRAVCFAEGAFPFHDLVQQLFGFLSLAVQSLCIGAEYLAVFLVRYALHPLYIRQGVL